METLVAWISLGVTASLAIGIFLSYKVIPYIVRGSPAARLLMACGKMLGRATRYAGSRALYVLLSGGLVTALLFILPWEAAAVAAAGLFAFYQASRRIMRESDWRRIASKAGYAYARQEPDTFQHEYLKVTHRIKLNGRDEWARANKIRAKSRMVAFKGMVVGVRDSDGDSRIDDYSRLAVSAWTDEGRVFPLPVSDEIGGSKSQEEIALVFTTPVKPGHVRQFLVAGVWPNLWGPLREYGDDAGVLTLVRPVATLEIEVVFPRGVEDACFKRKPQSSGEEIGQVREFRGRGGQTRFLWTVQYAEPGEYSYKVSSEQVKEMASKRKRRD